MVDQNYGPRDDIFLSSDRHFIGVLIETTKLDHFPIMSSIVNRNVMDYKPSSFFKLNVSHLHSPNLKYIFHNLWNIFLRPSWDRGWLLWSKVAIPYTMKFIRSWSHIGSQNDRKTLLEARPKLEEFQTLSEEDLYNFTLHVDAYKMDMVVRKEDD